MATVLDSLCTLRESRKTRIPPVSALQGRLVSGIESGNGANHQRFQPGVWLACQAEVEMP